MKNRSYLYQHKYVVLLRDERNMEPSGIFDMINSQARDYHIWAAARENPTLLHAKKQRRRSACANAQADQRLCFCSLQSILFKLASYEKIILPAIFFTRVEWFEHDIIANSEDGTWTTCA